MWSAFARGRCPEELEIPRVEIVRTDRTAAVLLKIQIPELYIEGLDES